jgi:hypothetical protein
MQIVFDDQYMHRDLLTIDIIVLKYTTFIYYNTIQIDGK